MAELNEDEQYQDLQEFEQASQAYQDKFGRSMLVDGMTVLNSQDLDTAAKNNPELMQFLQSDIDKYVPVLKECMASFLADMPAPVPEQTEQGVSEVEAGTAEEGLTNEQMQ